MLIRICLKYSYITACTFVMLTIYACNAPYILPVSSSRFYPLSTSIVNNNLVLTVDRVIQDTDPNSAYLLVLFSIYKDHCKDNCAYWEFALNKSEIPDNLSDHLFDGHITYGALPKNMRVLHTVKSLQPGQYFADVTLVPINIKTREISRRFTAINRFKLTLDGNGKWLIKQI